MRQFTYLLIYIFALTFAAANLRASADGFSQIVLTFPSPKTYDYTYNEAENSLDILVSNTMPEELEPLYSYDENFVKRIMFTVKDASNTEIKIVLKDQNVRATIYDFKQPYRIVIDFYDSSYTVTNDPDTGFPVTPQINRDNIQDGLQNLQKTPSSESFVANSSPTSEPNPAKKRRLLQPRANDFSNPNQLVQVLDSAASGIGPAWKNFPAYVYRLNITPYKTGTNYEDWMKKNAAKALISGESLASYAAQLYDFGHEHKALLAYQKILHDFPIVFEKYAEHLWRLAETHLGQGNLTLADGYYASLTEKHQEHPLSNFAKLRRLDIKAIKYKQNQNSLEFTPNLPSLDAIRDTNIPELRAQKIIRQAYWKSYLESEKSDVSIPKLSPQQYIEIESLLPKTENSKTSFLLSTLLLNATLDSSERWNSITAKFTDEYFNKFKGSATEPYRSILKEKASNMIHARLKSLTSNREYSKTIETLENLPEIINTTNESFETMNAIAKSYRKIGAGQKAAKAYKTAAQATQSNVNKFRMHFWQQQSLFDELQQSNSKNMTNLKKEIKASDKTLVKLWNEISDVEKAELSTELRDPSESSLDAKILTQIHPDMLKWAWSRSLAPLSLESEVERNGDQSLPRTVFLISKLSERFKDLGRTDAARDSIKLLQNIKPKDLNGDKQAESLWAKELISLAETYRKNNQFLEAGKLYTLTGNESLSWDGKTEALYKGGLLLYRSGKRAEAIEALNKAANDGSNLLYAELAKKRLEQLK